MKFIGIILIKFILNIIIFLVLFQILKQLNHYDGVCFITTVIATALCILLNVLIEL